MIVNSKFNKNCKFNELTGKPSILGNCYECVEEFDLPYRDCCLDVCGELEICRNCDKGIYKKRGNQNETELHARVVR